MSSLPQFEEYVDPLLRGHLSAGNGIGSVGLVKGVENTDEFLHNPILCCLAVVRSAAAAIYREGGKGSPVDSRPVSLYAESVMEIHFTPEQEAQLSAIAAHSGTDAEDLMKDAALRLVEEAAKFRAAVREGIEPADRGEFVEHEEVWANVEKILRS